MNRIGKQITIAAILLIGISFILVLVWRSTAPKARCDDGIKNQNETGIDCGGVCEACHASPEDVRLSTPAILLATSSEDLVEVYFAVENPNPQWGVIDLPYTVTIESLDGKLLSVREGTTYILPFEEHTVVEQAIPVEGRFSDMRVVVELGEATWVEPPEGIKSVELTVLNPTYERNPDGFNAAEIRGVLRNDSPFSYDVIDIVVVVSDRATGEAVSARRTQMRTITSDERREFIFTWRDALPLIGEPDFRITPLTNIFENENFLLEYGELREFQSFQPEERDRRR